MDMLLTSAGITNGALRRAAEELLPRPIEESNAVVIPTAAWYFREGPEITYRLITGASMGGLGWADVGVLELTAIPAMPHNHWQERLSEADAVLVGGGDPVFLAHWMRLSGVADYLQGLDSPPLYIGLSAGAMSPTASFGRRYNGREVPSEGTGTPLGWVPIALLPHVNDSDPAGQDLDIARRWAATCDVPTYALDDESAVRVIDGNIDVVSEGVWQLIDVEH